MRRATAQFELGHYEEAVDDLTKATEADPTNKEAQQLLTQSKLAFEERTREKELKKRIKKSSKNTSDGAEAMAIDNQQASLDDLRKIEKAVGIVSRLHAPLQKTMFL